MKHYQNRFELAQMVRAQFSGLVSVETLRQFLCEIIASDEAPGYAEDPLDKVFVCAIEPLNADNVFYLPLAMVLAEAVIGEAMIRAKTFGEFFAMCPGERGEWHRSDLTRCAEYPTLEDYLAEEGGYPDTPEGREEAKRDYDDLSPYRFRPPLDDDPFDEADWDSMCLDRDYSCFNPAQDMYGTVPGSIANEFGELKDDAMWGTPHLFLDPDKKDEISKAFEALGYIVVEDSVLYDAIYRMGPGLEETTKRVKWYEDLEKLLLDEGEEK